MHCFAIADGSEPQPLANVLKDVPAKELARVILERGRQPSDDITYFNVLYIESAQHRILVDAGWGEGSQQRSGQLLAGLVAAGINSAAIDTVVITHGDVDHIGGLLTRDRQPVYANATYFLPQASWDFWSNSALVARWPVPLTLFGREILPLLHERLQVVPVGNEFQPGMRFLDAPGHRPGHSALAIESEGELLVHLADTVGAAILLEHPDWHWAYDAVPEQAARDQAAVAKLAVDRAAVVFSPHLPYPGVGRILPLEKGYRWQPVELKP
jgi:glyoxylase-like metal-dependent hydrolase (beta-lactamase superfamily II)